MSQRSIWKKYKTKHVPKLRNNIQTNVVPAASLNCTNASPTTSQTYRFLGLLRTREGREKSEKKKVYVHKVEPYNLIARLKTKNDSKRRRTKSSEKCSSEGIWGCIMRLDLFSNICFLPTGVGA
ncbi:hypothetical protein TNCV_302281 [Trichonephila clavipes]|nr:hypothetical protein TNCV_302281 [Trichonephila clavipes]